LAKNGSFDFAKGWFVCRAKLNVPLLQLAFLFVFVMVVRPKLAPKVPWLAFSGFFEH
jgi:hypothetical protein